MYVHFIRQDLQFAGIRSRTALASGRMVGKNQFQRLLSDLHDLRRVRPHLHTVLDRIAAGSLERAGAFDFHQTHPAAADLADVLEEAERRDMSCRHRI